MDRNLYIHLMYLETGKSYTFRRSYTRGKVFGGERWNPAIDSPDILTLTNTSSKLFTGGNQNFYILILSDIFLPLCIYIYI